MQEEKQLSKFFILELLSICLRRTSVLEIAIQHLQYHFLPSEDYKLIWRSMSNHYQLHQQLITLGTLAQQFRLKPDVIQILTDVSKIEVPPETIVLEQLEIFIKKMIFIDTHRELAKKYNEGDDEGALELMSKTAEKLAEFSLIQKSSYNNVIGGMFERIEHRRDTITGVTSPLVKVKSNKIPTGFLLEIDTQSYGGIDRGDTFLWMAPSAGGKSKAIKYSGFFNAKIGNRVVHIQGEGTLKEAQDQYDAAFMGVNVRAVEQNDLGEKEQEQLKETISQIKQKEGEIHIKAFEQFDSATMLDVKKFCYEIIKVFGPIDLLLLDYLEIFDPGDGKFYKTERERREALGKIFKNLCMELNCAGISATQSMDIAHNVRNDSKFVLRREHISEFKGMVKPFSYFATINGTDEEIENDLRRIHLDKFRKYKVTIPTFTVATNFENERFYDNLQTQMIARYAKTDSSSNESSRANRTR
jgi:hypothetical protein